MAYLTVPALIGPVAGPPLGGFITTYFHWRWIFWINVPIGVLGVLLSLRFIDNLREQAVPRFDFKGFVLSGVGLLSLISGLSMIGRGIAPYWLVAAMIAIGALSLAAYVRHAHANAGAILDLKLLKIPTFYAGVVGGFIFRIGIGAMPFLLPLLLQVGFGLTPFASGSLTFAAAAGALVMKFTASTALRWFGFRQTLVVNGLISGAFLAACALFTPSTPHWLLLLMLLTGGFFRSLEFTALNAISYADIELAADEPRHQLRQRLAADVRGGRSRGRGDLRRSDPVRLRRFRAHGARPLARLRPGGDRLQPVRIRLRPAQAGRGRRGVGPDGLDQRRTSDAAAE